MSRKTYRELGMQAPITRRDFIQDAGLAALGLTISAGAGAGAVAGADASEDASMQGVSGASENYPPTHTGLRGSHPGAYDTAHAVAREGRGFPSPEDLDETYDLVVVGAGISGLAAAHFYRERFGDEARILLLDNHDDFGGHARRNEFHQSGEMRLALGGTHNLEWWNFSKTVWGHLTELGVDPKAMLKKKQFNYGRNAPNSPAVFFDEETYGENRLIPRCDLNDAAGLSDEQVDAMPLSAEARSQLKRFYAMRVDVLDGMDDEAREAYLSGISYPDFLQQHGGLGEEAVQLFHKLQHGAWGLEITALSARECLELGLPGVNLLGEKPQSKPFKYPAAMWPDGNASLARLQLTALIPNAAPGTTSDNVALAKVDYSQLDRDTNTVRLRLSATVIGAENTDGGVAVTYVKGDEILRLRARHSVLACYHAIIPHLCPDLPTPQIDALKYQVKRPLLLTNVLIRNTKALDKLGVDAINCPGRLHSRLFTFRGINTGGYEHDLDDDGPVSLVFWGSVSPPAGIKDVKAQHRASRALMLEMSFEDYEREVRTVLDGLLGPEGFDVTKDILAITVNRWPHGYSYDYLDLFDEDWAEGEAPHEIARRAHGNITIANSDAAADAYTHAAIDQAYRAVSEFR
ncbi:MAG: NAD(P)/FAD-dependent oxidoreductase [Congregibacter sp.]